MGYSMKCEHCGEIVEYFGIWEAELHWGHQCPEIMEYERRRFAFNQGLYMQPALVQTLVKVANGEQELLDVIKI